jgi:hypothetical protein
MRSDKHDAILISRVRPPRRIPPQPGPIGNLGVIGAGTAGLRSAIGCASPGGKEALVEKQLRGR